MDLLREKQRARGAHRAMGGGGSGGGASQAAQNYTAVKQMELSTQQLDWAKEIYAAEAPDRAEAQRLGTEVSEASLAQMRQQTEITQRASDDYNTRFRPLESQIVADATGYDTAERRAAESSAAVSDVEKQVAAQRGSTMREMERAGVNPASGKTMAVQASMDVSAAKAKAGAGNAASKAVETIGYARRMDAANLGRNIASSQGTSAAIGLQAGAAANASSAAGLAAGQSGAQIMQNGFAGAQQGLAGAGAAFGGISAANASAGAARSANTGAAVGAVATVAAAVII